MRAISKYKPPGELIFGGAILTKGFLRYKFGGLMHGRAYFLEFYGNYSPPRPIAVPAFLSKCVRAI